VRCNLTNCQTGAVEANSGPAVLAVYDVTGRLVRSPVAIRHSPFRLDLRSMPAGVYLVKVTTEGYSTTPKLVVQH